MKDSNTKTLNITLTNQEQIINENFMYLNKNDDIRIASINSVLPPIAVIEKYSLSNKAENLIAKTRLNIQDIVNKEDDRLVIVVGPCSIHDPKAAIEYAKNILPLKEKYKNELEIVMRVYFEKPRTTVGWKGLINDPELNGTYKINKGLKLARKLLVDINELGMPTATEFLDLISPQYLGDLISWGAIGARTTESQTHRELVSGLSAPVGFKNATDGDVKIAIDAILAAKISHCFLSITKLGNSAVVSTIGNDNCHIILRGGKTPNYSQQHVNNAKALLKSANLNSGIMIDFSHANSNKKFKNQLVVSEDVSAQISNGERDIIGIMIESNLIEGAQKLTADGKNLTYGQSITDECINLDDTALILKQLASSVINRRKKS